MIGAAAGVGVVLGDTQAGAVMEKPVKDERRLVLGGRDHGRVEGIVLVGGVSVEGKAWIDAVTGVDLAGGVAALARSEELAVGRRGGVVTPHRGDRQRVVRVDDARERGSIRLVADIGLPGPEEVVSRDALARLGHAGQAEVGGVGQDHGQERSLVIGGAARAQVERIWVPVEDNVWFRPLLLSASRGYWMNLLKVKKSGVLSRHRHPMPVHAFVLKGEWRYLDGTAQHRSAVSNRMPAWLGATTTLLRALLHRNRPPPPSSRPRRNQPSRWGYPDQARPQPCRRLRRLQGTNC